MRLRQNRSRQLWCSSGRTRKVRIIITVTTANEINLVIQLCMISKVVIPAMTESGNHRTNRMMAALRNKLRTWITGTVIAKARRFSVHEAGVQSTAEASKSIAGMAVQAKMIVTPYPPPEPGCCYSVQMKYHPGPWDSYTGVSRRHTCRTPAS